MQIERQGLKKKETSRNKNLSLSIAIRSETFILALKKITKQVREALDNK